jgi:hypothetical protein
MGLSGVLQRELCSFTDRQQRYHHVSMPVRVSKPLFLSIARYQHFPLSWNSKQKRLIQKLISAMFPIDYTSGSIIRVAPDACKM